MHLTSAGISTILHDMTAVKVRIPTSFAPSGEERWGNPMRRDGLSWDNIRPREQRSLLRVSPTLCVVARREMKPHSWVWLRRMQVTLEKQILPIFAKRKAGIHPPARDSVDSETSV